MRDPVPDLPPSCADGVDPGADPDLGRDVDLDLDLDRYPLDAPGSPAWDRVVARARADLTADGCAVLRGVVRAGRRAALRREGAAVAGRAHRDVRACNVYNTPVEETLPPDHPARVVLRRGNAFVPRDAIPATHLVARLYADPRFRALLAACVGHAEVHELADPLAGLCLNVVDPGEGHPWHFDTNEFAVSLLTQAPEAGGGFEYVPDVRGPGAENLAAVAGVLGGDRSRVRALDLRPGDLQIFLGRYALHRVRTVRGRTARHAAIFAYSARPGVVGAAERTRQLFGRVTAAHTTARAVRVDGLLD